MPNTEAWSIVEEQTPMKALSSILLLCFAAGCSGAQAGPGAQDPYRDVGSFCEQWGKAACNSKVVANCSAASADACVAAQKEYCLTLVSPSGYSSKYAKQCISAVHDAYADATLTSDEYKLVTSLAAPCDQLEKGPGAEGDTCSDDSGCNTLEGLHCVIRPGDSSGTCYKPKIQSGGFPCDQPDETCAANYYCDGSNCLASKAVGAACSATQPCVDAAQCVSGTCQAKAAKSAACSGNSDCQSDICAIAAGSQSGVCVDTIILSPTDPICTHLR